MRPLKESYVDGKFTEDTIILRNESRGHCGEEYEDVEETIEMQDDRTEKYKTDGDRLFPEEGRVDAKMAEESQRTRGFHCEWTDQGTSTRKYFEITTCFQNRFIGIGSSSQFLGHCKIGDPAEATCQAYN